MSNLAVAKMDFVKEFTQILGMEVRKWIERIFIVSASGTSLRKGSGKHFTMGLQLSEVFPMHVSVDRFPSFHFVEGSANSKASPECRYIILQLYFS